MQWPHETHQNPKTLQLKRLLAWQLFSLRNRILGDRKPVWPCYRAPSNNRNEQFWRQIIHSDKSSHCVSSLCVHTHMVHVWYKLRNLSYFKLKNPWLPSSPGLYTLGRLEKSRSPGLWDSLSLSLELLWWWGPSDLPVSAFPTVLVLQACAAMPGSLCEYDFK